MAQCGSSKSILQLFFVFSVTCCFATSQSVLPVSPTSYVTPSTSKDEVNVTEKECTLTNVYAVTDTLDGFLLEGAKLIKMNLALQNYTPDFLRNRLKHVFQPHNWVHSGRQQGRKLLALEDQFAKSLYLLSIGVKETNVTLVDSPPACLKSLDEEHTLQAIRTVLLNDLKPHWHGRKNTTIDTNERICNMKIKEKDRNAEFIYTCCHKGPEGHIVCNDITEDTWTQVLEWIVFLIEIIAPFFSPLLLSGYLYRDEFESAEYIYRPSNPTNNDGISADNRGAAEQCEGRRIKFSLTVVEDVSRIKRDEVLAKKVVRLRNLKDKKNFKNLVMGTNVKSGHVYEVTINDVRLSVKSRKLLQQSTVPADIFTVLYNYLLRCRLRKFSVCEPCLRGKTWIPNLSWYQCGRVLAKLVLPCFILIIPAIRIWVYVAYEKDFYTQRIGMAERLSLEYSDGPLWFGFMYLYIASVVVTFVVLVLYGFVCHDLKHTVRLAMKKSLGDMYNLRGATVCKYVTKGLIWPCEKFGVFGILLFVVFLLTFGLLAVLFYILPLLYLTWRFMHHLRSQESRPLACLIRNTIKLCFISSYCVSIVFTLTTLFCVEVGLYTLMGIIVNVDDTLDYITVAFFVVLYARTTFHGVFEKYLIYHRKIHEELLTMTEEGMTQTAMQNDNGQANIGFHVDGYQEFVKTTQGDGITSSNDTVKVIVRDGKPAFETLGILLFLDETNTVYTPELFFYETIKLNHPEAPGPLYISLGTAFRNFALILGFLFFVFTVVMALGDTYKISRTNKLLAAVAGSFVPFLFQKVFVHGKHESSIDPTDVPFKKELHKLIKEYKQVWPMFDIAGVRSESSKDPPRRQLFPSCVEGDHDSTAVCWLPCFDIAQETSQNAQDEEPAQTGIPLLLRDGHTDDTGGTSVQMPDNEAPFTIKEVQRDLNDVDMILDKTDRHSGMCPC